MQSRVPVGQTSVAGTSFDGGGRDEQTESSYFVYRTLRIERSRCHHLKVRGMRERESRLTFVTVGGGVFVCSSNRCTPDNYRCERQRAESWILEEEAVLTDERSN